MHNAVDSRLLVVTLYVLRFIHNACQRQAKLAGPLAVAELNVTKRLCRDREYPESIIRTNKKSHI